MVCGDRCVRVCAGVVPGGGGGGGGGALAMYQVPLEWKPVAPLCNHDEDPAPAPSV